MNKNFIALPNNQVIVTDEFGNMTSRDYIGNARDILLDENINECKDKLNLEILKYSNNINTLGFKLNKLKNNFKVIKILESLGLSAVIIASLLITLLLSFSLLHTFSCTLTLASLTFAFCAILNNSYEKKLDIIRNNMANNISKRNALIDEVNNLKNLTIEKKVVPTNKVIRLESIDELVDNNKINKVRTLKK